MQLSINNVGIIKASTINVDGLTVVTGANNSGKSTIGKTAYALVRAVEDYETRAAFDRCDYAIALLRDIPSLFPFSIRNEIRSLTKTATDDNSIKAVFGDQELLKKIDYTNIDVFLEVFQKALQSLTLGEIRTHEESIWYFLGESKYSETNFESDKAKALNAISQIIHQINDDPDLKKYIKEAIRSQLITEFAGQIAPVKSSNSLVTIDMTAGEKDCFHIKLKDGKYSEDNKKIFEWSPYNNVFYIDDPYAIEDDWHLSKKNSQLDLSSSFFDTRMSLTHREHLKFKIKAHYDENVWEKVQTNKKFKHIVNCLDSILPGSFISENDSEYYQGIDGSKLKISNLATGSKMFSILKKLIVEGLISDRTLLILDEPECHLHPEWQNIFAEIVVLLVKEMECHILLTTHSQNFLLALDAYTRKYNIKDKSNFYQASQENDGTVFKNVNSNLKAIYADFVQAFSRMKNIYDELVYGESINE